MDAVMGRVSNPEPSVVTRGCLVCAALLPWLGLLADTFTASPFVRRGIGA